MRSADRAAGYDLTRTFPLMFSLVLDPVLLSILALINVGLWTVRVALTADRRRVAAAAVAAVEATAFVLAFARLVDRLDDLVSLVAYAVGVAAGTMLALTAEDAVRSALHRRDHAIQEPS